MSYESTTTVAMSSSLTEAEAEAEAEEVKLPVIIRGNRSHTGRMVRYLSNRFASYLFSAAAVHTVGPHRHYVLVSEAIPLRGSYVSVGGIGGVSFELSRN
jgi:carbamoylphosphate synthase large subunit